MAQVNSLNIKGNELIDFIVEEGSNDNWSWRKWNNGTAECWFKGIVTYPTSGAGTGILDDITITYVDLTLPIKFSSSPCSTASIDWNYTEWIQSQADTDIVRLRVFCNPNSLTKAPNKITSIYCIGKWK